MDIEFRLSHVFHPSSNEVEDAIVLKGLLDLLIKIDLAYLQHHPAPLLYRSGVVYGRTREWLGIPDIRNLGYADCKSLASWRIAEIIHNRMCRNKPVPQFRWQRRANGVKDYHILIMKDNGEYECPSRLLGMGHENRSWG